jgi:ABC-2 type transport system ATP-binding protein
MGSAENGEHSIRVENLTKRYGDRLALDGISFSTEPGEIVGFLGPNGAGKSTTMRILTCFMPATDGTAHVAGFDVFRQSIEVRRRIGYLPENVPLYPNMRVREYLDFRSAIKMRGAGRKERRRRIDWAVEQCHIIEVRDRIIGQLSKGYRQRVGLADSLVHDPEVLILDEPTEGLDPNQTRDVRELVKRLANTETSGGRRRTVLFSTHIIPWVERVCERVMVIDRGRIVADGGASALIDAQRAVVKLRARMRGNPEAVVPRLRASVDVSSVDDLSRTEKEVRLVLWGEDEARLRSALEHACGEAGTGDPEVERESIGLEDVFRNLTHAQEEQAVFAAREREEGER